MASLSDLAGGLGCFDVLEFVGAKELQILGQCCKALRTTVQEVAKKRLARFPETRQDVEPNRELLYREALENASNPQGRRVLGAGEMHSVFICKQRDTETLMGMGDGACGRLGKDFDKSSFWRQQYRARPVFTGILASKVKQICCGSFHTAVLMQDSTLYVFGELGRSIAPEFSFHPPRQNVCLVPSLSPIVQIASTTYTLAFTTKEGTVHLLGRTWPSVSPRQVRGFGSGEAFGRAVSISAGNRHLAVVTEDGKLYTWGFGSSGRLGHGSDASISSPKLVEALAEALSADGDSVKSCSAGWRHTVVVTELGKLYAFGCGEEGQLGQEDANMDDSSRPVRIMCGKLKHSRVVQASAGIASTVALLDSGEVIVLGKLANTPGQASSVYQEWSPRSARISQITVGSRHVLALGEDNCLYSFGCGRYGKLGHESNVLEQPTRVVAKKNLSVCKSLWHDFFMLVRHNASILREEAGVRIFAAYLVLIRVISGLIKNLQTLDRNKMK